MSRTEPPVDSIVVPIGQMARDNPWSDVSRWLSHESQSRSPESRHWPGPSDTIPHNLAIDSSDYGRGGSPCPGFFRIIGRYGPADGFG